jgi:uridine kinase
MRDTRTSFSEALTTQRLGILREAIEAASRILEPQYGRPNTDLTVFVIGSCGVRRGAYPDDDIDAFFVFEGDGFTSTGKTRHEYYSQLVREVERFMFERGIVLDVSGGCLAFGSAEELYRYSTLFTYLFEGAGANYHQLVIFEVDLLEKKVWAIDLLHMIKRTMYQSYRMLIKNLIQKDGIFSLRGGHLGLIFARMSNIVFIIQLLYQLEFRGTLEMFLEAVKAGLLSEGENEVLSQAYLFFCRVAWEMHSLGIYYDSKLLPRAGVKLDELTNYMGFNSAEEFVAEFFRQANLAGDVCDTFYQRVQRLIEDEVESRIEEINPYPLAVPAPAQQQAERDFARNTTLTDIEITGSNLKHPEAFLLDHFEVLSRLLKLLEQLLGRAPPFSWRLVITTDLTLTQGNVASCDIDNRIVYIHPYFFSLPQSKQLEILYHELISHIEQGLRDEDIAMRDTQHFMVQREIVEARIHGATRNLKDRVAMVVEFLAGLYKKESLEVRTLLSKYPPYDKVFYEEILPAIKDLYGQYLRREAGARVPTIILFISGEGGIGKTATARQAKRATNVALAQEFGSGDKTATQGFAVPLLFDDYILQKNETGEIDPATDRSIDPLTGKPTENPLEKFQVARFINDMRALLDGQTIYKPVFDFSTRGRLKFLLDRQGNLKIVDGQLTIPVEMGTANQVPYFIYEGSPHTEITLDNIPLSIRRNQDSQVVINLRGSDTVILPDAQGNLVLCTGTCLRTLARGQQLEALEAISPDGKVFIVEGILTLSDSQLCRRGLSLYITGDYQARELRMIVRASREKGRKMTEEEFVQQRRHLVRTEEIPFIRPTRDNARWVATTLSRSEAIYMLYTRGELYTPVAQVRRALQRLNIDYRSLVRVLKDISNDAIRLSLASGEIVDDKVGTAFKVVFIKGGVVVKVPRLHFMNVFDREFSVFYTNVLKKRLGGLMVPGTILNVSELNIHLEVDGRMVRLGKVLIQNTIPTLKERLLEAVKQGDMRSAKGLIDEYFQVQLELARRGIIDTDPKIMEKYGLVITDGVERVVVMGVDGLTINYEAYDPNIYTKDGMRPVELPAELVGYYDQKAAQMPASSEELKERYFKKGIHEAHEVADIYDIQISKMQMAYIVNLLRREKIRLLRSLFMSLSYGQDNPFIYWLKLYLDTMYPEDTPQNDLLHALYEMALSSPEFLEAHKPQRKRLEDLMRSLPQADILDDAELYSISQDLISYDVATSVSNSLGVRDSPDLSRTMDSKELTNGQKNLLFLVVSIAKAISRSFSRWFTVINNPSLIAAIVSSLRNANESGLARLSQEISDNGRIHAGPRRLFAMLSFLGIHLFGFNFRGFIIINPAIENNQAELARTIIHETAAISGRTHQQSLELEQVYSEQVGLLEDKATTVGEFMTFVSQCLGPCCADKQKRLSRKEIRLGNDRRRVEGMFSNRQMRIEMANAQYRQRVLAMAWQRYQEGNLKLAEDILMLLTPQDRIVVSRLPDLSWEAATETHNISATSQFQAARLFHSDEQVSERFIWLGNILLQVAEYLIASGKYRGPPVDDASDLPIAVNDSRNIFKYIGCHETRSFK